MSGPATPLIAAALTTAGSAAIASANKPGRAKTDPAIEKRLADQEAAEEARKRNLREQENSRRRAARAGQSGSRSLLFDSFTGVRAKPGSNQTLSGSR